jgi:hypothetical protein
VRGIDAGDERDEAQDKTHEHCSHPAENGLEQYRFIS